MFLKPVDERTKPLSYGRRNNITSVWCLCSQCSFSYSFWSSSFLKNRFMKDKTLFLQLLDERAKPLRYGRRNNPTTL